ncbi:hypothetical protein QQS21_007874 [Conoideocrella luteorostrata]|uniref:G-patch domain-containing protein n=1 Tax=Conoideocrella luteorostrata TaxID=1105319 RepID=A0AAJ0FZ46_9HYPO|nr:hypothetical protein QQS21_007874 [Conoideocrella luteorostrata]
MAAPPPPPPPKAPFSLYDNLLDPNDPAPSTIISSSPVLFNQSDSAEAKRPLDPALRFQPIRRPPVKQAKAKATTQKTASSTRPLATADASPNHASSATATTSDSGPPAKSSLADWTATEEDEWRYGLVEKRQRGGRKKRKKQHMPVETDWEEIYDPSRPTNIEEYLRSDEKIDEVREWKALLYRHRKRRDESDMSSEDDDVTRTNHTNQFAPPPSYGFVPPPPQSPQAAAPADESADDAYARRMGLSSNQQPPPPPPSSPPAQCHTSPPPPTSNSATISRAPIRYTQPTKPSSNEDDNDSYSPPPTLGGGNHDNEEEAQQRSNRPGQAGFAQRLMGKYGWTQGSGLGADESGIVNPLRVQVEKRRKKADADGGGWAEPSNRAKIIGSKRKEEGGKFGIMSNVVVVRNMLENMPDLEAEIADGLGQEIGEECGEKYGRVERLYIDRSSRQVFIKFTTQVSALRAVNELDGRNFNGNNILPKFYDPEMFDKGIYSIN